MYKRPVNVAMASVLAIIGGIVSLAFLAVAFTNTDLQNGDLTKAVTAMLMAVLFFGFAGQCFPNGKGAYLSLVCLGLITVIASAVMIIIDTENNLKFGIAFFVLAALMTLLVLPTSTEKWISVDRE